MCGIEKAQLYIAHIDEKKLSLAQKDFQSLKPGNTADFESLKFILEYKCFPCE